LDKSAAQTFNDKVNLIYEYNKQSPLFVRVASGEIDKNNVEKAVEILNEGLSLYPDYPVAHILLGKALMLKGKYKDSLDSFRKGSELVNSHKVYEYYLQEVENLKKQRALFESSHKPGFINESNEREEPDENPSLEKELTSFDSMDEQKNTPVSSGQEGDTIVSETLANIYITQGELREALSVFERLLNKNPQKREYYEEKINELKTKLN
jgi:tetratricopeptide (TPR) repeat protein